MIQHLDESIFKETQELGDSRITIGVFSYGNGPKKVQISREKMNADGEWRFAKLGRLTKEEFDSILPILQQAQKHME